MRYTPVLYQNINGENENYFPASFAFSLLAVLSIKKNDSVTCKYFKTRPTFQIKKNMKQNLAQNDHDVDDDDDGDDDDDENDNDDDKDYNSQRYGSLETSVRPTA